MSNCLGCGKCYFKKQRFVGTRGNPKAKLVIIGESPGYNELAQGQPFIGASGKMMEQVLANAGMNPDEYFITNAMQCLPVKADNRGVPFTADQNKKHMQGAVRACNKRLMDEVLQHPRDVILCLGNAAFWALTGQFDSKITQIRGELYKSQHASIGIIPTVHPAFLLRGGGGYTQKFKDDLHYAADLVRGMLPKQWQKPLYWVASSEEDISKFHEFLIEDFRKLRQEFPASIPPYNRVAVGADIETSGFDHRRDYILCAGYASDPRKVYVIPEELIHTQVHKKLLEDEQLLFAWHNGKFDIKFLRTANINARVDEDTMLGSYVLNENRGLHDLDQVARDMLGAPNHKQMLDKYLPNRKTSFTAVPRELLMKYMAYDVSKTINILYQQYPHINNDAANTLAYRNLYIPASEFLADIESNGIQVNLLQVRVNAKKVKKELADIKDRLDRLTSDKFGRIYNPASPKQVQELLYTKLCLQIKGKTPLSTDEDTLKMLPQIEEVKLIREHRKAAKLYGTYIRPLIPIEERTKAEQKKKQKCYLHPDGKIYATYLIHGTKTGRLSSRNPNMQNQPRLVHMRNQYMADPDHWFLAVDYNQAELRCLAYMSGDENLIRIYSDPNAMSIHYEVSIDLWGKSWLERYTEDHKQKDEEDYNLAKLQYIRTKAVNFGIVYGRESFSIAEEFNITPVEAQEMIDGWARKFPKAWAFIQKCREAPVRGMTMKTIYGRRKRATFASKENMTKLANEAANFPHQSTASDFTLDSGIRLNPKLAELGVKPILIVHDELSYKVPMSLGIEGAKRVAKIVVEGMEETPKLKGIDVIPFTAEPEIGFTYGSLHKFKGEKDQPAWIDTPEALVWSPGKIAI